MLKVQSIKDNDLPLVEKIKLSNCNVSFETLSNSYDNFYFSIARKYSQTLIRMGMSKKRLNLKKILSFIKLFSLSTLIKKLNFPLGFATAQDIIF
jgi:hypothetical protein